jgi:RNA ligase
MITFEPFPKLARLSRGCTITEKLDGTNAQIIITPAQPDADLISVDYQTIEYRALMWHIGAGSRTRLIKPGKLTDNYGFAGWVWDNAAELVELGEGRHFGEWYGKGIQRGYGLTERRFALFDTARWPAERPRPACVDVVPVLHTGEFSTRAIEDVMYRLSVRGSSAVPGFMDPEGIVIWHSASRTSFKKTFDDKHKEAA